MTRLQSCMLAVGALAATLVAMPERAGASFHLWEIAEVYSNADGSVQYIEFTTTSDGQGALDAHMVRATSSGVIRTFTFHGRLVGDTAHQRLLVATPGFAALPGAVAPDYVLPCGPFFDPAAASITVDFVGANTVTFSGALLPTNGSQALYTPTGGAPSAAANSPTNFAGDDGALALTACLVAGTCEPCDDGFFCDGAESCSGSACFAVSPCGSLCDEAANVCVECLGPADCEDAEACTAESCEGGACVHTPVAGACDDGQFCTAFDACASGTCSGGPSSPCGGENCNEDGNFCGECALAVDCEDGDPCTIHTCDLGRCFLGEADDGTPCADNDVFCDGAETCSAGGCQSAGTACDTETQTCNEDDNVCVPIPEPGASAPVAALFALAAIARSAHRNGKPHTAE